MYSSSEGHTSAMDLNFNLLQRDQDQFFYDHNQHHQQQQCIDVIDPNAMQQFYHHTRPSTTSFIYGLPESYTNSAPADMNNYSAGEQYSLPFDYRLLNEGIGTDNGYELLHENFHVTKKQQNENSRKGKRKHNQKGNMDKTEKQRRERFSMKYDVLKSLIPNQTKPDRATIIADAIEYINELVRTVNELKMLVARKRQTQERNNHQIITEEIDCNGGDTDSSSMKPVISDDNNNNKTVIPGGLRSSWLQRRSKDCVVDVRIVEDEVYVKITQRKSMINCLLIVPRVLDDLQLQLLHLTGGNIGDSRIFMLNTKIQEISSVYAGAIAKKLIEAMEILQQSFGF